MSTKKLVLGGICLIASIFLMDASLKNELYPLFSSDAMQLKTAVVAMLGFVFIMAWELLRGNLSKEKE